RSSAPPLAVPQSKTTPREMTQWAAMHARLADLGAPMERSDWPRWWAHDLASVADVARAQVVLAAVRMAHAHDSARAPAGLAWMPSLARAWGRALGQALGQSPNGTDIQVVQANVFELHGILQDWGLATAGTDKAFHEGLVEGCPCALDILHQPPAGLPGTDRLLDARKRWRLGVLGRAQPRPAASKPPPRL